jgi:hypothetical protein
VRLTSLCVVAFLALASLGFAADKQAETGKVRITQPVLFGTPESDKILASLQIFPPDNPWNQDVSRWPLHPNSRSIIASIGVGKPMFTRLPTKPVTATTRICPAWAERRCNRGVTRFPHPGEGWRTVDDYI